MRGHNINIYFSEETYNKIKPLIAQRKVSEFVNSVLKKAVKEVEEKIKKDYRGDARDKKLEQEMESWAKISRGKQHE